jgi:hypothetical protein
MPTGALRNPSMTTALQQVGVIRDELETAA